MKYKLAMLGALLCAIFSMAHVNAAAFNANNLIDDTAFDDTSTMTEQSINGFLNQFSQSCISPNNGFSAADPIGYNPTQGFIYGGNVSAGQVIFDAAQAYGINPQVLLTTMEKEQNLITGVAGCSVLRYAAAAGYGCPDGGTTFSYSGVNLYAINGTEVTAVSGTCVNTSLKVGFTQQVIRAAWLLKFGEQRSEGNINWAVIKGNWDNSDDPQSCYGGPMTQGTWQRCPSGGSAFYDGYTTIDSTSVHMDTGATAALYWYTPHFPGNQNFDSIFQGWFGSLVGSDIVRTISDPTVYLLSGTTKYPITDPSVWSDFSVMGNLKYVSDTFISGYTTGPILTHLIGDSNGTLYFVDAGIKLPFSSCTSVSDYGYSCSSTIITLANYQLEKLASGPAATSIYATTSGKEFYITGGQKREVFDQQSLVSAGVSAAANMLLEQGISYLAYGLPVIRDQVVATDRSTGQQYFYESSKYTPLTPEIGENIAFKDLPRASLDDASIPSSQRQPSFNGFMTNIGATTDYVITATGKAAITNPSMWTTVYTAFSDTFLNSIPADSDPVSNGLVKSSSDATVYYVIGRQKRPIPSWLDLVNLHVLPFAINTLPDTVLNSITAGPLMYSSGRLVKTSYSATVYVVEDATHLYPITNFLFPEELGLNLSVLPISSADLSTYTIQPPLQTELVCDGTYYIGILGKIYAFDSGLLTQYGFTTSSFADGQAVCLNAPVSQQTLGSFIRVSDGTIYLVQNGQKQAFTSYQAYLAHGGTSQNTTQVSDYFASLIVSGANITQ